MFIIVGALVLLLAVINFVNLTTARASMRAKEIGVRKVTGAMRSAIIGQFIGEAFVVVTVAFLLGTLIAKFLSPVFSTLVGEQMSVNLWSGQTPVWMGVLLCVVALLAGLYPAFVLSSFQPVRILKGQTGAGGHGSAGVRRLLMVIQLGISTAIIVFSAVLYLQMRYIADKDLGFDKSNTIRIEPTWTLLKSYETFKNELLKAGTVVAVGAASINPLTVGGSNTDVEWQGKPNDLRGSFKTVACMYDMPEAMGLKILEGRGFLRERGGVDSLDTDVLVTKEAVKVMQFKNPIGEKIKIGGKTCQIVGVINDFHTASLRESREPVILFQSGIRNVAALYVRYREGMLREAMHTIEASYRAIEPDFTMRYWFQDDTFDELYKTERTASRLILIFTIVALIIALVGVVGLATFNIMRRTKEISVRRVMGASVRQVLALLSRDFVFIIVMAAFLALPVAWYAANTWLAGYAYRIDMPWWVFGASLAFIFLLTVAVIFIQALKSLAKNPASVLRTE